VVTLYTTIVVILYTTRFNVKQDRQCTYNVTLVCIRVTTVAVENQQALHIPSVCLLL